MCGSWKRKKGEELIGISTYENALLFDPSNATARTLRAGDVLMIKNLIARKVLAAEETPETSGQRQGSSSLCTGRF
jgi:hypothetical protein